MEVDQDNLQIGTTKAVVHLMSFAQITCVWSWQQQSCIAIMHGIGNIYIRPGSKVLYLGAASGTTVSHVSTILILGQGSGYRMFVI